MSTIHLDIYIRIGLKSDWRELKNKKPSGGSS